jgi:excisionase family DNA binding protein
MSAIGLVTVSQAARYLGVSRQRIGKLIAEDRLPFTWSQTGRHRRILRLADLDRVRKPNGRPRKRLTLDNPSAI